MKRQRPFNDDDKNDSKRQKTALILQTKKEKKEKEKLIKRRKKELALLRERAKEQRLLENKVDWNLFFPEDIIKKILLLVHHLEIKEYYNVGLYGLKELVVLYPGTFFSETISVYVHPRELQIVHKEYCKISEKELDNIQKTIICLSKLRPDSDKLLKLKNSTYLEEQNLFNFYYAWNIPEFIKTIDNSKKYLDTFNPSKINKFL